MRGNLAGPVDPADAPERFAQDFGLVFQLRFVRNVLVIAAAANAEMNAARGGAFGRRLEDALDAGANELLSLLDGRGGDALGRQNKRDEDGRAVVVRETFASIDQFFDGDFHEMSGSPRPRLIVD